MELKDSLWQPVYSGGVMTLTRQSIPLSVYRPINLRRALERYYLVAGHNDPVYIDIPKGTYVPVFTEQSPSTPIAASRVARAKASVVEESWPTILIRPF